MYSALSTLNTTTEVALSKALCVCVCFHRVCVHCVCVCVCVCVCSLCVCVFTAVCVHFGWVKCRAHILSIGYHTWLYVTSLKDEKGFSSIKTMSVIQF